MFQTATGTFKVRMLYGEQEIPSCPKFTLHKWVDGNFTQLFERYVETHVGFRRFFIRLRNSVRYTFLNKSNEQVVMGKNNVLYEKNYIRALYGEDSAYNAIQTQVARLKTVSDTLNAKGIKLLVILAPGKATMYPDEIPFEFSRGKKINPVNYLTWKKELSKNGMPFIDMRSWFKQMHDTSSIPVFTRLGVHWTVYGSYLAADSMLAFMEHMGNWNLGRVTWTESERTTKYRQTDADLMEIMNLLNDLPSDELVYPKVTYTQGKDKPNVLAIGDSYYWSLMCDSIHDKMFADSSHFWFYNDKVFGKNSLFQRMVTPSTIKEEVEKRNMIILLCTEPNLYNFPFKFGDQLYDLYVTGKKQ